MQLLEDEKVHNLLTIGEFPLYAIPLDEDILSFELDLSYKVRTNYHYIIINLLGNCNFNCRFFVSVNICVVGFHIDRNALRMAIQALFGI